jgi:hypothetical protein
MGKTKSKWGHPRDERRHPNQGEWRIRTRRFDVEDGTHFYQVKFAKNDWSMDDVQAASFNWHSAPPRKRKEFATREAALEWGMTQIAEREKAQVPSN